MARKSKNSNALDEALDEGSPAGAAMAAVEGRRAKQAAPLALLVSALEALEAKARAHEGAVEVLDAELSGVLEQAMAADAKVQVLAHVKCALEQCDTGEQVADHLTEALHVLAL